MMGRATAHAGARPEQQSGSETEEERVEQDSPIDVHVEIERHRRGKAEGGQGPGGPERQGDAGEASAEREQHAFREHLAQQVTAGGSQGEAHGHLAPPAGGVRQKHVGDVGAGDRENQERHQRNGGQKHQHRGPISGRQRAGGLEAEASALLRFGMGLGQALGQHVELGRGLGAGDAGPQAADHGNPVVEARPIVAGVGLQLVHGAERNPELAIEDEVNATERRGSHAHHGERPS